MNITNLFDYSNKLLKCHNTIIYISEHAFYISILSINENSGRYNYYADEWLYLINYNYPIGGYYNFFVSNYNNIIRSLCGRANNLVTAGTDINNDDIIYYNKNVISLMTTFCKGSVHGYSGFWYTFITYLNNIEKYNELDIIMYNECDSGILSIINYFCSIGIIKNEIIFLDKNIRYKFDSVTYIENEHHVFNGRLENMVTECIEKYSIINNSLYNIQNNICIIKSNTSNTNISNNGIFDNKIVDEFCNKYNIYRVFPKNEIQLINLIYNCKILILNYGSTFFKNYVYVSEKCEKIIVIVNGDGYINDYNYLNSITSNKYQGIIYKKYKNAEIKYVIVNNNGLNFDPYII